MYEFLTKTSRMKKNGSTFPIIFIIVKMSDMKVFEMFKAIRWNETNGDIVCR